MPNLKEGNVLDVNYTDTKGVATDRTIIPIHVPSANVSAVDVTGLSEVEQSDMADLTLKYNDYVTQHMSSKFSFEDWANQTTGKDQTIKFRHFNKSRLKTD